MTIEVFSEKIGEVIEIAYESDNTNSESYTSGWSKGGWSNSGW